MSQVTYSNVAITKVLLLRGNTIQNARYLGLPGEPTIDLEAKTLRIHDGVTVGGHEIESTAVTNNGYNIGVDSTGALLLAGNGVVRGPNGGNGPVNLVSSNFVQMQWTANANVADPNSSGGVINWAYVDDAGFHVENVSGEYDRVWNFGIDGITQVPESITSYSNTLKLAGSVGDLTADKYLQIRPGAIDNHIHFDTGDNSTYDLFVGDDSKYVNVSHDGNVYVGTNGNTKIWNFNTDGTITLPGAIKFNTTGQQLYTSGTGNNDNFIVFTANVQNDINGIQIGEVNQGATIYTSGAVQLYANTAGTAPLWAFNTDGTTTFPDSTVQTTAFNNAAVSSYLADTTLKTFGDGVTITGNLTVQGNVIFNGNATLVSTNNLIINDNIIYIANANPGSSLDIGIAGHFTSIRYQHTGLVRQASTNQWQLFSNVVPEPGATIDFTNAIYDDIRVGNITSPTITGINANVTAANVGILGYINLGNTIQSAQVNAANLAITSANVGMKGYVDAVTTAWTANANIQQALIGNLQASAYSNINVAAYLSSQGIGGGNYSNVNVAAYLAGTSYTGYSNVNVNAWFSGNIFTSLYSNVNVAAYLAGNVTVGTITTTGNVNANNLVGTSANTTITAGTFVSTFNNAGNVILPNVYVSGNVTANYILGNGALLTGITASSSYSNVQVATYLPTYTGVVTASNVAVAGNITAQYLFGNGALLTGIVASGSTYGNTQVATYLPTYSGNIANITLSPSGILTFADGTTQTTAGGGSYSNVNVSTFLANSSATFINSNIGTISNLQASATSLFLGANTAIVNAGGIPTFGYSSHIGNNIYFDANGVMRYRNTQTGASDLIVGPGTLYWYATGGAVTANTATGYTGATGAYMGFSTSGVTLYNGAGLVSAGPVTIQSATGLVTNQSTIAVFNGVGTTINMGGVASTITLGSTGGTGNVFFGGNAIIQAPNAALGTNLYPLVLRPQGQYNYLLLYGIAGGYNAPPYTAQALTGGSGTGMTASYSTAGNGYVTQASLVVVNPGTGYKNGDVLTLPNGLGTTVILYNYNPAKTSNTAASSYTFGFDGNLTLPGNIIFPSSSYIYGDFSNATVNSRTVFVTTGNSTTTGVYAVPSGTGTGAAWQAANSSNLTAASKIMITTNGTTDVQLVSGINGSGTYLPLSFYNNGAAQMQLTVAGNLNMSLNNSISANGTGYFIGNSVGTTASYTGNVTVGNLTITGIKNNVPVKAGGFVAQNTAVSMDSVTTQWLNNGGANANQLQLAALNGNVSILYTYIFEAGTGGSPSGGSSTTTLANLSFGWTSIGNASGVAGDMYNVLVSLPGVNAYRITAMTGSGYSNNVLTIERLI